MSEWGEPRRWDESDLPDDLRRVLESAAADDDPARVRSLEERLAPLLGWPVGAVVEGAGAGGAAAAAAGGGPSAAGAAATGAAAAGAASTAKVLVAVLVTAGAVGGGAWLASDGAPSETSAVAGRDEPASSPDPPAVEGPRGGAREPELHPSASEATPSETIERTPAHRRRVASPAARAPALPAAARSRRETQPAPAALAEEVAAIDSTRRALETSPYRALELAEEHRARFGDGVLGPERDLLRIEALLALGRDDEAQALADDLLARDPRSAHARTLRRLLREHGEDTPVDNPYGPSPMHEP